MHVTCSFQAKPALNITWIYNVYDDPDTTIIHITHNITDNNPYVITTSTLTWKTNNDDERKTVSGIYTCKANNTAGSLSLNMTLDIQCKYFLEYRTSYQTLILNLK